MTEGDGGVFDLPRKPRIEDPRAICHVHLDSVLAEGWPVLPERG